MSDIAIRAEGLSKSYRIDHEARATYRTLRESLASAAQRPLRRTPDNRHETIWALQDVSFEVRRGEALGIIGRNGAGKSTLLKILSRITRPTTGRADVYGRLGSLLEVGTGFHPELTGRENIFLNGAILGMSRSEIQRHFDEIVAFAETEQFLDTPVKRYSTGMYMRLAFAVAAHLRTDILVVDEVLAVGDAAFQGKCLGKMTAVASEGRTVLFVSHNMAAIRSLCDEAMVIQGGRTHGPQQVAAAIDHYLVLAARPRGGRTFESGDLLIESFGISQGGIELEEYDGGEPIDVEIRFSLARAIHDFRIGVVVRTEDGDAIARCLLADWDRSLVDLERGPYVLRGSIPAGFLTGGRYQIGPHASVFNIHDYELELALGRMLSVVPPADFNAAYPDERARRYLGLVTMDVGWSVERHD